MHGIMVNMSECNWTIAGLCVQGTGLGALEEAIVAQAEQCEVSGDHGGQVEGTVIEARVDRGLG